MRLYQHITVSLVALTFVCDVALAGEDVPKGLSASDWSGIRAAYETNRHSAFAFEGSYVVRNPGQQWRTTFDGRGFITTPEARDWSWGLELVGYGDKPVSNPCEFINTCGQRVEYAWDDNLTEWYINDGRGLEHGYTLSRRPNELDNMLTITLAVRGDLCPSISGDGRSVGFVNETGAAVVNYGGLAVFDATGAALATWFECGDNPASDASRNLCAEADPSFIRIVIDDTAAEYPLTIDPIAQQAYLKASNTGADDYFGNAVAISGDTVVVGAFFEDSSATGVNGNQADESAFHSGAAYIFVRDAGGVWSQEAYLKASNTDWNDWFGYSVAVSGDTVVVGAYYEDSSAIGVNGNQADNSFTDAGAAYIFVRSNGVWSQQAYLKASNTGADAHFGGSVAVSEDTVLVGALGEASSATGVDGNQADNSASASGAAYVFVRDAGGAWSQQAYLKASNTGANDRFGGRISICGDTVVIGAFGEASSAMGVDGNQADNSAVNAGAAYIFVRNAGGLWSQQAYLKASNTQGSDIFGGSVAVCGDTVVVGAYFEDSSATGVNGNQADNSDGASGAAYVFVRNNGVWIQQAYLKASNTNFLDEFGISVAVSGDTVVVGAWQEDSNALGVNGNQANNSESTSGAAYVFVRSGGVWSQQAYLKASNTEARDEFGRSVAVSGDTVVVGAWGEDSSATGINGDQANDSVLTAGAAYVFTGAGPDTDGDGVPNPVDDDIDGDGLDNEIDTCPSASPCAPNDPTGQPWSDLNADCFVNGLDVQVLADCVNGGSCSEVDPDGDGMSVDLDMADDIAAFVAALIAPVAAPCP